MIDFEVIESIMQDYGYLPNVKAYKDDKQSGLIVNCGIQDSTDREMYRLFIFNSVEKMKEFLELYIYMLQHKELIKLEITDLENFITQKYRFIRDGKEFTYSDLVYEIENKNNQISTIKQEYISLLKEDYLCIENKIAYFKFINSLDITSLENIFLSLETSVFSIPPGKFDFDEKSLEVYIFKPINECSIDFSESDIEILADKLPDLKLLSKEKERRQLYKDFKSNTFLLDIYNHGYFYKYIENEEKYKKAKMYIEKIKYLLTLKQKSRAWILLNRKNIKKELKNISNKYHFLSIEEISDCANKLNLLYSYFEDKQREINANIFDDFYLDDLMFVKLCLGVNYEEGKDNIDLYCKKILAKRDECFKLQQEKSQKKIKVTQSALDEKKRIYLDLIQQYENSSLTYDEKMALLAYNSALFLIINVITSIPNYENMTEEEIKNVLSDQFRKSLELSEMFYPKGCDTTLYYFQEILRIPYQYEQTEFGKYIKEIIFNKHYIKRILDIIKILNNIRCDIVLPEDITVYRCISTDNPNEKPVIGSFLSTSLSSEAAKRYYQTTDYKKPVMYKIKIKKGTPITAIFPQKVVNTPAGKVIVDDLTSEKPVLEIMLNMNDYEMEPGSMSKYQIYDYHICHDNQLRRGMDYIVYEMTIIPKGKIVERQKNDSKKISR
ncbi:MAG: hypothetical protein IKO49_07170 [Bacilli bacterium]|nr:hypothetical protein [Bacilli bacterium]